MDIINFIEKESLYKYKNSIIVFSGEITLINKIMSSPYLYSYVIKGGGFDSLIENLNSLIQSKEDFNKLNYMIDVELRKLNFNFSHIGTRYLREVIVEVYKVKNYFDGNFKKNIYPIIAKRYNKKVNTIYCDIKQSIKSMILNNSETDLISYFHYSYPFKPKVNEIIFTILNKL